MGVARMYRCGSWPIVGVVVRRYIDILIIIITFPYSTCISWVFLAAASLLLCFNIKMFFLSCLLFLCNTHSIHIDRVHTEK